MLLQLHCVVFRRGQISQLVVWREGLRSRGREPGHDLGQSLFLLLVLFPEISVFQVAQRLGHIVGLDRVADQDRRLLLQLLYRVVIRLLLHLRRLHQIAYFFP